jgi:serine/threonine protein kinase
VTTGDWNPNELLGAELGSCRLERVIGVGGMGAVYLAQQTRPRRQVAVKVLRRGPTISPEAWQFFLERFASEADLAANLDHANIVPIFEFGQQGDTAFLVMPYLAHGTLADLIEQRGRLSLAETVTHVEQAAAALDHAHQRGLVHRDVKPSNLLLHPDGRLMLADFGIARPADPLPGDTSARLGLAGLSNPNRSEARRPAGTPEYMAPEQIRGGPLTPATDVYALATVAYTMLAGQPPFADPQPHMTLARQLHEAPQPLRTLRTDLPQRADETILGALAKDPAARPQGAGIFAAALRRASARSRPLSSLFPQSQDGRRDGREPVISVPRGLLRLAGMFVDNPASEGGPSSRAPLSRTSSASAPRQSAPVASVSADTPAALSGAYILPAPRRANGTQPLPQGPGSLSGRSASSSADGSAPRSPAEPEMPPALPTNLPLGTPSVAFLPQPTSGAGGPAHVLATGPRTDNTPTIFDGGYYQRAATPGWPAPARNPLGGPPRARRSFSALKLAAAALVAIIGFAILLGGLNQVGLFAAQGAPQPGSTAAAFAPTATTLPTETPTIPPDWLRVSPTNISLQCKGKNSSQNLTIRNLGDQELQWHIEAPGYTGLRFSASDGTLDAGGKTTIVVSDVAFTSQSGTFSVVPDTDGAGDPATITFSASGCVFGGEGGGPHG